MITLESSPTTSLTCPRDGGATRLTCGRCGTPICPACLVRTEVGLRCPDCAGGPAPSARRARRWVRVVVAAAAASVVAVTALSWDGRSDGNSGEEVVAEVEGRTPGIGEQLTVGRFAVTVTGFECSPDGTAATGTPVQRCEASLLVRNDSLAPQGFSSSLQAVREGIRRFPAQPTASTLVAPGQEAEVILAFRLPQTLQPGRLELRAAARQAPVRVSLQP